MPNKIDYGFHAPSGTSISKRLREILGEPTTYKIKAPKVEPLRERTPDLINCNCGRYCGHTNCAAPAPLQDYAADLRKSLEIAQRPNPWKQAERSATHPRIAPNTSPPKTRPPLGTRRAQAFAELRAERAVMLNKIRESPSGFPPVDRLREEGKTTQAANLLRLLSERTSREEEAFSLLLKHHRRESVGSVR